MRRRILVQLVAEPPGGVADAALQGGAVGALGKVEVGVADRLGEALGARAVNAVPFVPPVSPGSDSFWRTAREPLTSEFAETPTGSAKQALLQRYPLAAIKDGVGKPPELHPGGVARPTELH